MATVSQLIAALQKLPPDMPVFICHPAQCCCGECFCPPDEYVEADAHPYVSDVVPFSGVKAKGVVL